MAMEATTGAADEFADEYFNELPAGYRFKPTDEVLVVHYLKNKVLNKPMPLHRIKTCNIYRSHPSELCGGDNLLRVKESYFFTPRERKYPNGSKPDRKAGDGFWKATGREFPIQSKGELVGFKNTLVYYEGNPKGTPVKTNWLMQEYRLNPKIIPSTTAPVTEAPDDNNKILDKCVLAKIYHKPTSARKRKASPIQDDSKRQIAESEQLPAAEAQYELILKPEELSLKDQNEMNAYFEEEPKALQFPAPPQETLYHRAPQVAAPPPYPYHQNPMPAAAAYHGGNNNVMNHEVSSFRSGSLQQTDQYSYSDQRFSFQVGDNGFWNSQHGGVEDYCYNSSPATSITIANLEEMLFGPADASTDQNFTATSATQAETEDQKISRVFFPK